MKISAFRAFTLPYTSKFVAPTSAYNIPYKRKLQPKYHHPTTTVTSTRVANPQPLASRCISCSHWMPMASGSTLSTRFAESRLIPLIYLRSSTDTFASPQVQAGEVTKSAHPARFSPDDKYSSMASLPLLFASWRLGEAGQADGKHVTGHRVTLKKRYGLLLTQNSEWTIVCRIRGGVADWTQKMKRSWGYRDSEDCKVSRRHRDIMIEIYH